MTFAKAVDLDGIVRVRLFLPILFIHDLTEDIF